MSKVTFLLSVLILLASGSIALGQKLSADQAAEKIRAATPAALPQAPVVKKGRSDAWDAGLKGKVKEVETLVGRVGSLAMTMSLKEEFDTDGALLRQISYDHHGNPTSVTVYGYIDGKRVAIAGYISYDYNRPPPPASVAVQQGVNAKRDPRYFYAYEADYGSKGELTEKRGFGNDGKITFRTAYVRSGGKRERTSYNSEGKPRPGMTETFDEAGNVFETVLALSSGTIITQYKYEINDAKGNWTRRIATIKDPIGTSTEAQVRMISYH